MGWLFTRPSLPPPPPFLSFHLQVEAAVLLYDALLNKASFAGLLQEFDDKADRDNVCHRLGLTVAPDGTISGGGKRR